MYICDHMEGAIKEFYTEIPEIDVEYLIKETVYNLAILCQGFLNVKYT